MRANVIPGFGTTLGITLFYLGLVVLIPLAALVLRAAGLGFDAFIAAAFAPRVMAAYRLSVGGALIASLANLFIGLLVAWVLVRYRFPGRRLVDAIVDLPFALPTSVAGIALTAVYAVHGPIGAPLARLGIKVAYTPLGVIVAMAFIGLPFVVRTVQPVLQDIDPELEDAATSLGAGRFATFRRVLLPVILPALVSGFAMAFARGLGEYGSVIFIAGNFPGVSEIAPLLIVTRLDQYDYAGATAIAVVILAVAFVILLAVNTLQKWHSRRFVAN
jgi:sulfate transport system permease protein